MVWYNEDLPLYLEMLLTVKDMSISMGWVERYEIYYTCFRLQNWSFQISELIFVAYIWIR